MPAPAAFALSIAPDVITNCVNTGIFPSVVIAQAIEESGSGTSKLAGYNNLFGHAASSSWLGKVIQTVKGGRFWRVYDSIAQCVAAHIRILKKPLYLVHGILTAKTPYAQALALQHAGYNTGPDREQYALKLAKIIKGLGLEQYDKQLIAIERKKNKNGLAFHEQSPVIQTIKNLI